MASTKIKPLEQASPTIYAYITPNDLSKKGWVKIGYTDRDAKTRIKEQTHTSGTKYKLLWSHDARYDGGEYFTDNDFHWYLVQSGIEGESLRIQADLRNGSILARVMRSRQMNFSGNLYSGITARFNLLPGERNTNFGRSKLTPLIVHLHI
jgi:hypothetical protein